MEASVLSQFLWLYCCTVSFSFSSISPGACIALVDKGKPKIKQKDQQKKNPALVGWEKDFITPLHGGLSLTHIHKCSHVVGNTHTWTVCPMEKQRPVLGVATTGSVPGITLKGQVPCAEWTSEGGRGLYSSLQGVSAILWNKALIRTKRKSPANLLFSDRDRKEKRDRLCKESKSK